MPGSLYAQPFVTLFYLQIFAMAVDGSSQLIGVSGSMPNYKESEEIIAKGREAKLEIFQRSNLLLAMTNQAVSFLSGEHSY